VARSTVLAERLTAQLLSQAVAGTVLDVVRRLLAVQAQDPRGARLAIRARSRGLLARDVDYELTAERSIVISTVNRGTLHLMRSDDYWWLHQLTTPQLLSSSARRLAQEQVSPADAERALRIMRKALAHGPVSRDELRQRIASAGIRVAGQAFAHIVLLATIRGLVVRGPVSHGDHKFVLVDDWLGAAPAPMDRNVALGELARRYLAGHGPASEADLARWAGVTLGDARRGFSMISDQLVPRPDGLAATMNRAAQASLPGPRLLGAFDPSLLGWVSREAIIGEHKGIVTSNGVFRPFAMVKGRAVATWKVVNGRVDLTPFATIGKRDRAALDSEADEILDFLAAR
jgi:hypothetical protein